MNLRLPHTSEYREQKADDGDDQAARKRIPESIDVKAKIKEARHPRGDHQHHCVDHEDEQPKRKNDDRQREQLQQRPDARIQDAEYKGDKKQRPPASAMLNPVDQLYCNPQRSGVNEQAQQEMHGSRIL